MIEVIRFGGGFRADGPGWHQCVSPYLAAGWRHLGEGVYSLDEADLITNRLTVLPDGTGRLNMGLTAAMQQVAERHVELSSELYGIGTAGIDFLINEETPVSPVLTLSTRDTTESLMALGQNTMQVMSLVRLAGVIRYNP